MDSDLTPRFLKCAVIYMPWYSAPSPALYRQASEEWPGFGFSVAAERHQPPQAKEQHHALLAEGPQEVAAELVVVVLLTQ
jgi:hypothetical protein